MVRTKVHAVDGADALVGGQSALYDDTLKANTRDSKVIIPVTLLVVLLILMLLLRAVTAPLILIATVVLSFGTAIGLGALAFKYVFDYPAVDPSYPLFVFVFLVSLGIDYNIFLMTRVREETAVRGTREGALVGLAATGGVITSAGLVLAATFAILASLPLVFLVELGFTVALGRAHRHDHRPLGAGDRDQPRPRQQDLVAEQARPRRQNRHPRVRAAADPPRRRPRLTPERARGPSPGVASRS